MDLVTRVDQAEAGGPAPKIQRNIQLDFLGDWGQANFHRICGWLSQELCQRAGPKSTVSTHSMPADGGLYALTQLHNGAVDLAIATPTELLAQALTGGGYFKNVGPMPGLRALAVLPQTDRLMLAVDPKYGVKSWADIRRVQPPLRIVTSDDETSSAGFLAVKVLEAHGLTRDILESWGGALLASDYYPAQCADRVVQGEYDCFIHEAIMTVWWRNLIENHNLVPIAAEPAALEKLQNELGVTPATIRAGFWKNVPQEVVAVDFSDFHVLVRDDMPDDIAHLLTWALVNTRAVLESQYIHIPSERSPVTWPIEPAKMAKSSIPLHPAAKRFYYAAGLL